MAFLAVAAATSPFWKGTARVLSPRLRPYRVLRRGIAFEGVPMDAVLRRLDAVLPLDRSVAFGRRIKGDKFLTQRFTETLYPRRIDARSPFRVEVVAAEGDAPRKGGVLARGRFLSEQILVVLDPWPRGLPAAPSRRPGRNARAAPLLVLAASALAAGLLLGRVLAPRIRPADAMTPAFLVIASSLILAVLATASTMLQVPLPWGALVVCGALMIGAALFSESNEYGAAPGELRNAFRMPENFGIVLLLLLFALRMARFPIVGWDGRSIWMFKAKQFFTHGMLARSDALDPAVLFSGPRYPPLFPAWAALFGSLAPGWDERVAAMGITVLFAALIAAVWVLGRAELGRWTGAAFAAAAFFGVEESVGAGYMDGLLALLLVVEFLAFQSRKGNVIAWTAAAAASLLKSEGLVFAVLVAAVCLAGSAMMQRKLRGRSLVPFLLFLPAVGYVAWARAIGLTEPYEEARWHDDILRFRERMAIILRGTADILSGGSFNYMVKTHLAAIGAAAMAVAIAVVAIRRKRSGATAMIALVLGLAFASFAFCAMFFSPRDVDWHVGTALARLLIHPSLFFMLAALAALRDGGGSAADGPTTASGPSFVIASEAKQSLAPSPEPWRPPG